MKKLLQLSLFVACLAVSSQAVAGPKCTSEPQEKWLTEDAMKLKISEMGYKNIKIFKKTKGNCYEIYGFTADDKKVEVYFNPVSGAVVEEHVS